MAITSWLQLSPRNAYVPQTVGYETFHPWVMTCFFAHVDPFGTSTSTVRYESFPAHVHFGANPSAVRFNNNGSGGLKVTIGSVVFDIPDFEDGHLIHGFEVMSPGDLDLFNADDTAAASGSGSIVSVSGSQPWFSGRILVYQDITYFLKDAEFGDGTVINLRGGVPIIGTDGNDTLTGFGVNNSTGEAYDDTLDGRGGNDHLYGYAGNDTLIGGKGRDYMAGGKGADSFVYTAGMSIDRIADFKPGTDKLDVSGLTGVTGFADMQPMIHKHADGAVVAFSATEKFILVNVNPADLTADDFLF